MTALAWNFNELDAKIHLMNSIVQTVAHEHKLGLNNFHFEIKHPLALYLMERYEGEVIEAVLEATRRKITRNKATNIMVVAYGGALKN